MDLSYNMIVSLISLIFTAGMFFDRVRYISKELSSKASKDVVDNLQTTFNNFQNSLNLANLNNMTRPGSPLCLTEYAQKVLLDIEFDKNIFPKIKDDLLGYLEKFELRTPYDVQEKAQLVVRERRDDAIYDEMKKAIYKTGNKLDEVLAAIWIPLRDYYFEKHPEIME